MSHALAVAVGGKPDLSVGIQSQSDGSAGTMKLSVALFFAGLFGALAAVFILLSFGTDYWLLASETCHLNSSGSVEQGGVAVEVGVQATGGGWLGEGQIC